MPVRHFDQITDQDLDAVGGKGLSLGLMTLAGIPVPPGFCLTSATHRDAKLRANGSMTLSDSVREELHAAYQKLGQGPVAVRSSATVEDGAAASFAGQQETILGVEGEAALEQAVIRCWASLDSERALAYRKKQNVDESLVAMAVVVQRLVASEVSGVLFTFDPMDPERKRMMVEAAWGLGESVVSGRVMPDRYHLDRQNGAIIEQEISTKLVEITAAGTRDVEPERQRLACLNAAQLAELVELGHRIEKYYGEPRDIEWAWAEGRFWILQARPITTAGAYEREEVRREEIAALRTLAAPGGTVWAKYNLAEVLPSPTPLTWGYVKRFMSGRGGFGLMYRDLGFEPEPIVDQLGFIDLVCGRPYVNLSREARLNFPPYGYHFADLKAAPEKALYPQPGVDPTRATGGFWLKFPLILYRIWKAQARIKKESQGHAERLRREIFPQFAAAARAATQENLTGISSLELVARIETWRQKTLDDFARQSLRPSVFAGLAIGNLERGLTPALGAERAASEVRTALTGARPDPDADLAGGLLALSRGTLSREDFLTKFGHRGSHEMELGHARWAEEPGNLPQAGASQGTAGHAASHDLATDDPKARWERLATDAALSPADRAKLEPDFHQAHEYLGLRESSKHYLMLGYGVMRRLLVELDRRSNLNGGIFYLEPDELPRLAAGEKFDAVIAARKTRRTLALSLDCPTVLFSDDLEALGRPQVIEGGTELKGTPVSAGIVEGPAFVLEEPASADGAPEGFVLVCPSTDPAWVPLFLLARGLVMETGGVLSHGAIVAREFGLPAVAGISQVHRRIKTGDRVRIDGNTGVVLLFPEEG